MKITIDFSKLFSVVRQMGITEFVPFQVNLASKPIDVQIASLSTRKGIEIPITDIVVSDYGTLTYQGKQVLLFIPDHGNYFDDVINGSKQGNKFHIADCKTLDDMRIRKRFNRYAVTTNTDGHFEINDGSSRSKEIKLTVCKNCLQKLNYKNYQSNSSRVYAEFNLSEFFNFYQTVFKHLPAENFQNNIGYSEDWSQISKKYRELKNYCCEECGVNLINNKHLLDVHHKDGVKRNNSFDNLKAVCRLCHSLQENHSHMVISTKDKNLILSLRNYSNY